MMTRERTHHLKRVSTNITGPENVKNITGSKFKAAMILPVPLHRLLVMSLLLASLSMTSSASDEPIVMLNNNETRVQGRLDKFEQLEVYSFLGIPYAKTPNGSLRFQKPILLTGLPPEVNATQYGAACLNAPPAQGQSEDCLFLNVWVPAQPAAAAANGSDGQQSPRLRPVIVWVHGGGFVMGDSSDEYGGFLAAENDVIVVSMNYRLGPLGFLSTGDWASVGNYGLWDQHTALLWVQRNIAAFGGDPGAVTLMGESAGGKSVSFQVVSPRSRGLFHQAIMQSGVAYCPTALQWKPEETALRLGRAVGCSHTAHDAMVDCLRQKSAFLIANVSSMLWASDEIRMLIDFGWAPVQDRDFVPQLYAKNGTLLPLSSTTAAFNGTIMIGVNNNEGSIFKLGRMAIVERYLDLNIEAKLLKPNFFEDKFVAGVLQQMFKSLPNDTATFRTAAEVVTYKYRDWTSDFPAVKKPELYSLSKDQAYVSPAFQFARQWLTSGLDQVFLYVFNNYPDVPSEPYMGGMKHGDDVPYTFGAVKKTLRKRNASEASIAKEAKLGKNFRKLLTNFAKTGDPSLPSAIPGWPAWPLYNLSTQSYLSVSSTPLIATHYDAVNVALWTDLVPTIVTGHRVTCPEEPGEDGTSAARSCLPHRLVWACWIGLLSSLAFS